VGLVFGVFVVPNVEDMFVNVPQILQNMSSQALVNLVSGVTS
jgi:hypothetical protein